MNKMLRLLLFSLVFVFVSCSSDSETDTNTKSTFNLAVDGEIFSPDVRHDSRTIITKTEDTFLIDIYTDYGNLVLSFKKSGQFGYYNIDRFNPPLFSSAHLNSFYFNTSDNFTFNLISIDETNKRVKGNYSGYIYSNPLNLNSEKKFIEGDFDLLYEDNVPGVTGLVNKAKINGNNWLSSNKFLERDFNNITQRDFSGNEYEIITSYNWVDIQVSTYNFTSTDLTHKVELAKFDPLTGTNITYNCSGNFAITKKEGNLIAGVYNFTAVNPNNNSDVIQVTDGVIKLYYYNF